LGRRGSSRLVAGTFGCEKIKYIFQQNVAAKTFLSCFTPSIIKGEAILSIIHWYSLTQISLKEIPKNLVRNKFNLFNESSFYNKMLFGKLIMLRQVLALIEMWG